MPRTVPASAGEGVNCGAIPSEPLYSSRENSKLRHKQWPVSSAVVLILTCLAPTAGGCRDVHLVRRYLPGRNAVYRVEVRALNTLSADPPQLKSFLPPVPSGVMFQVQDSVTTRSVASDGSAELENRFTQFRIESGAASPGALARTTLKEVDAFAKQLDDQAVTVHYDAQAHLLHLEGADALINSLDAAYRDPAQRLLLLLLDALNGTAFLPDRPGRVGDEWTRSLSSLFGASPDWGVDGKALFRLTGTTRFEGVRAAVIEFEFSNIVTPRLGNAGAAAGTPLLRMAASDRRLEIKIIGNGRGRVLVAKDDGRMLQNQADIHEVLSASLPRPADAAGRAANSGSAGALRVELSTDARLEVNGNGESDGGATRP
jgi:hypothetical protein